MARWFVDRLPQRGIPSVSLRRLLPEAHFVGCPDWEVSGCTDDHRRLDPGQVFVAVRDARYDGHAYVREALDRGAAGVVCRTPLPGGRAASGRCQRRPVGSRADLSGPGRRSLPAADHPGRDRNLRQDGHQPVRARDPRSGGPALGLVGSLGWSDGKAARAAGASAPGSAAGSRQRIGRAPGAWPAGASGLAAILSYMVDQNCVAGVLEVSAEALDAPAAWTGSPCEAAVVTDIGVPYGLPHRARPAGPSAQGPGSFGKIVPGGAAVVNADDPHAEILGTVNLDARRVSFGMSPRAQVDVSARIERLDAAGSRFVLHGFDRSTPVEPPALSARAQVSHALAAAAASPGRWRSSSTRSSPGSRAWANVAGHLESVTTARTSTCGSTRPRPAVHSTMP